MSRMIPYSAGVELQSPGLQQQPWEKKPRVDQATPTGLYKVKQRGGRHDLEGFNSSRLNPPHHPRIIFFVRSCTVAADKGHDLWAVNTDMTHQEAGVISKTGLQCPPAQFVPA